MVARSVGPHRQAVEVARLDDASHGDDLLALPPRTPKGGATIHVFGDPVADPVIAVDRTPGKPVGAWTVQVLLAKTAASVGTWTFWAEGDDALGRTVVTEETQVRVGGGSVLALE